MDDWETKYWQRKQQQMQQQGRRNPQDLPHYEPAHIAQDRQRATNPGDGWRDVDPLTAMYTNMDGMQSRGMGPERKAVVVRPGAVYYKAVETGGFGTTIPLVRNCGPYHENVVREFEMLSECRCYVIDKLETVDLNNIDPDRMIELVQVRAPFVGTMLVEKSAVVGASNSGPQVLKG